MNYEQPRKLLISLSTGSIYLFKDDTYWKFTFPGSSPQEGYPRSSAADWLNCADSSSSSPVADDLSLSLSPPAGRQEFREQRKGEKEEDTAERRRHQEEDRHQRKHKDKQDRGSHIWTQCSCQNGTLSSHTASLIAAVLLTLWTLFLI